MVSLGFYVFWIVRRLTAHQNIWLVFMIHDCKYETHAKGWDEQIDHVQPTAGEKLQTWLEMI